VNCSKIILRILFVFIAGLAAFAYSPAQSPEASSATPPAEVTKEDDHLPFMRQDPTAQPEDEPSSASLMAKSLGALMLVVGLIFFGAWGAKKLGFGNTKPEAADAVDLYVVNTLSLGSGRSLVAVNFEGRTLLVGSTPNAFTLIAEKQNSADASFGPRSVAEMLREEGDSFRRELEAAEMDPRENEVTA
jgi:flagellar biogenesis protein FliO